MISHDGDKSNLSLAGYHTCAGLDVELDWGTAGENASKMFLEDQKEKDTA